MTLDPAIDRRPRGGMFYTGWVLSLLPSLFMLATAAYGLSHIEAMQKNMAEMGMPGSLFVPIAVTEIACIVIYLIPNLAVLGAILLTGYLGGAVMTHLRAGQPFWMPVAFGVIFWLALFLRDARIRDLIPWRRTAPATPRTLSI